MNRWIFGKSIILRLSLTFALAAGLTLTFSPQGIHLAHAATTNISVYGAGGAYSETSKITLNTPGLGTYPDTNVVLSSNITITPNAAPTDTTGINVSTDTNFKGTFAADPATGVINVTNAHPAGTYSVTVKGFGTGLSTSKTFSLTVTTGEACTATPAFSGTTDVGVGSNPQFVAVGDFNNDGKQDLAVANVNTANVSIRLGDGAGGFSGATNVNVGSTPISLAVVDFNNDGKQDLAVANNNSNSVSIRMGDGAGGFSGTTDIGVGSSPYSIAVGDFNNDGRQDFAVAKLISNTVSIWLGNGLGGFSGTPEVSMGNNPYSVAVGDFNNDGKLDFATANIGSFSVSIRLGDGTGRFSSVPDVSVGSASLSVVVGDFNNDGKQDLAVGTTSNLIFIRLGDGAGGFSGTTNVGVGGTPYSMVVGDFNNDANLDLMTTNDTPGSVSIRLGDGAGGLSSAPDVSVGSRPYSVAVGDFNSDGKQDFATPINYSNTVSIRLGNLPLCYDGNDNTGGSTPAPATYTPGATVTVTGAGTLVKTGYTFSGWNTAEDGSGSGYAPAGTFNITAPTSLYAQWTINTYTVTYNGNDNTSGTAPDDQTKTYNVDLTLATNLGGLSKTGYTFNGWNTLANGSGTHYDAGGTYSANSTVTLYAEWAANTYTVTFDGNGGGTPIPTSKQVTYGSAYGPLASVSRPCYTFDGWYDATIGGIEITSTTLVSTASNHSLYAHWTVNPCHLYLPLVIRN